ncbi:Glycosyltransferase Family 90 domain containing protein [Podochytrium sp. JEL0797]|nr:Glycosyltransferase Family 90 domain containing protein [Podochytrium sp. JEL0797]
MIHASSSALVGAIGVLTVLSMLSVFLILSLQGVHKSTGLREPAATVLNPWKSDYQNRFGRSPPKNFGKWLTFAQQSSCPTNLAFYLQIYADLKPWFEQGYIQEDSLMPFRTDEYQLFGFDGHHSPGLGFMDDILPVLQDIKPFIFTLNYDNGYFKDEPRSARASDPLDVGPYTSRDDLFSRNSCLNDTYGSPSSNATLHLNAGQSVRDLHGFFMTPLMTAKNLHGPVFSQSKLDCYADIMMPQDHHHNLLNDAAVPDVVPWEEKQNVLFWRGSTTGGQYAEDAPWRKYHRTKLMDWAQEYELKHPGSTIDVSKGESAIGTSISIDIAFSFFFQTDAAVEASIRKEYGVKDHVSFQHIKNFKYLLVVDGFTWPARLQLYLATNSVILYNGIFTDFFNRQLIPFVHYVPFKLDYSDLEERLEWLQNNEDKAREIVANAQALMKIINSKSYYNCYMALLMLEYSRLFERS